MAKQNKFEQLVEFIINEDEAKAKALFHKIVVEKSRDIYESLVDEDQFPVQRGRGGESLSDEIEDHDDVIDGDEHGMHEDEEDDFGDDDFGGDEEGIEDDDEFSDDDADMGGDEEFGDDDDFGDGEDEGSVEDRVMDLEDAIDELKAEFDQLMAGEEHEEEEFPGIHGEGDPDTEMADELDSDEGEDEEFGDDEEEVGESASVYESDDKAAKAKKEKEAKAKKEKAMKAKKEKAMKESRKSPADLMREYVEKVAPVKPAEGDFVGTGAESGGKPTVNKKSTQISGKNDMGGSSANIARGGSETAPDGTSAYKKPSNYASKGEKKMGQDTYANTAGGRGDKLNKVSKPSSKEGSPAGAKNTDGTTINDKSIGQVTKGKPGFKG